jgi:hypothetical protein
VAVIKCVAVVGGTGASRRAVHQGARQVAVEPVTIDPHLQPAADQARRRTVEDTAHGECAAAGHECFVLDEVRGTTFRQILQLFTLNAIRSGVAPVSTHYHLTYEFIARGPVSEVAMASKHQRLVDSILQIPMREFHTSVLVTQTTIVTRALHSVMIEQSCVTRREVLLFGQVPEGGRQAVGAMFARATSRLP